MAATARLGRAAGAAGLSTLSALAMHALAGGHAPSGAATALALAASFAVAAQLTGRPLGRLRLAGVAVSSQAVFHAVFTVGGAAGAGHTAPGHHTHGAVAVPVPTEPTAALAHHGAMPLAHVVAAAITYAGVRRAHTLLGALTRLARMLARVWRDAWSMAPAAVLAPFPARPTPTRAAACRPRAGTVSARVTRGPPHAPHLGTPA